MSHSLTLAGARARTRPAPTTRRPGLLRRILRQLAGAETWRRDLLSLDTRLLADIGLTRDEARRIALRRDR
ncbi:hypothetical protein [Falsiroseomonas selenitidurans]|uniref:DUF1127 domain-containing protein n=1 Tax=Falsiroseomonas selenitidurans TaxID=2716335 RepID=A0ABX1E8Y7_9PROT|nr:hypothetical protein [Falsiroseomonas selenitidurans]NKC32232.1 hypothetical protein [Falsiroseomonas selenitidurans]